jgi:hypothetical protein
MHGFVGLDPAPAKKQIGHGRLHGRLKAPVADSLFVEGSLVAAESHMHDVVTQLRPSTEGLLQNEIASHGRRGRRELARSQVGVHFDDFAPRPRAEVDELVLVAR